MRSAEWEPPVRHSALRNPQSALGERGALQVLAIGIGAYSHPRVPRLDFASSDARDLAAALEAQAGDSRLYASARVTVLTDTQATLPAIRAALDTFTREAPPAATLVLILSGHGFKDGGTFYFAPVGLDPEAMACTGLPWPEVLAALQAARRKARMVWLLADCCRAAPALGRELPVTGNDLPRAGEGGNLLICTASSGDTSSYESADLKHGLFTQAWLEALRGEAPDLLYTETPQGRALTLAGLEFIVDASVARHAREAGVRQKVEFPRLEGRFSPSQPLFVPVPPGSR